nr:hypothetical protein [Chloroflexota bacterium]
MQPYWLCLIALIGAGAVGIIQRWRAPMVGLGLATMIACTRLVLALPLNETATFLGQPWSLDQSTQALLTFVYGTTMVLLAIAATAEQAESFYAPVLASVGLLSVAILLRSWLSFLLLPAALIVLVLATPPAFPTSLRGASRFLAWATLPVPFLLAIPILLERFALFPDQQLLAYRSAWLVVPPLVLWLTLFPLHGTTPLWASGNPHLTLTFLWTVKDWVVLHLFLTLWQQNPVLHTEGVTATLSGLGLLTTVFSGVWAVIQTSPSAVLGCAAISVLGLVVQGVAVGSGEGLLGAMSWLVHRSVAVLLASSALIALYSQSIADGEEAKAQSFPWQGLILFIIFIVCVLDLAGMPLISRGLLGYQKVDKVLQETQPRVIQALWIRSAGIIIGLIRVSWRLWHDQVRASAGRIRFLSFSLVICIFLVLLWLELSSSLVIDWVSTVAAPFSAPLTTPFS